MALGWRGQYLRYKDFFLNVLSLYKKRADLRMFLEVILSLSTITIFALFALKPTVLTIISLVKEINEKERVVLGLDEKINNIEVARSVYSQNEFNVPIINQSVPTSASPNNLIRQVEGLASKNGVSILGISIGEITLVGTTPTKKKDSELKPLPEGAKEMSVSISVGGSYQNLRGIIQDIENLRIPVNVDILGVNSSETEAGRVIVSVISGRTPYIGK